MIGDIVQSQPTIYTSAETDPWLLISYANKCNNTETTAQVASKKPILFFRNIER